MNRSSWRVERNWRTASGADGTEREGGRVCIGIGLTRGLGEESVAERGRKIGQFRQLLVWMADRRECSR
jgi:hypothetical protein